MARSLDCSFVSPKIMQNIKHIRSSIVANICKHCKSKQKSWEIESPSMIMIITDTVNVNICRKLIIIDYVIWIIPGTMDQVQVEICLGVNFVQPHFSWLEFPAGKLCMKLLDTDHFFS